MSRFILPFARVDDKNGHPLDGAKLYFYETGTSTPKDTYSDFSLSTPNANPVIADSQGQFGNIFMDGLYRVELKDKNDVTQPGYPADNIPATGSGSVDTMADLRNESVLDGVTQYLSYHTSKTDSGGGHFIGVSGAAPGTYVDNNGTIIVPTGGDGSAAWIRQLQKNELTPPMFGAQPGATVDNFTPIQAMIDVVRNSYNNTLGAFLYVADFGGESWMIGTSLDVTLVRQPGLRIQNGGLLGECAGQIVMDFAGSTGFYLKDFIINCDETNKPSAGIYYGRCLIDGAYPIAQNNTLDNVLITGYVSKVGLVNFASEVSTHDSVDVNIRDRGDSVYAYANVGHAGTLDTYVGGLTSAYQTLPNAASGSHSNILHDERQCIYRRRTDINVTITGITQANPAVVSVAPADLVAAGLTNGDLIWMYKIVGMTELNYNNFIVGNLNEVAGTFELAGIDSTIYTAFTSGSFVNKTGPAVLLNGSRRTDWTAGYMLTYGESSVHVDLDNGAVIKDCSFDFQSEADVPSMFEFFATTGKVIQKIDINLLNDNQFNKNQIIKATGGGVVRIDGGSLSIANMGSPPALGLFNPEASFNLRDFEVHTPLEASMNPIAGFVGFTGRLFYADTNRIITVGYDTVGLKTSSDTMTDYGIRFSGDTYRTFDPGAMVERELVTRGSAIASQLADITHHINTTGKYNARMVKNTTTGQILWAAGGAAGDVWNDANGTLVITPV